MNYINGNSLDELLKSKGALKPRQTARIIATTANALHHVHKKNIIHRDIKPANIIIDKEMQPYLTDFGLAKSTSGGQTLSKSGHITGTFLYMSPEQMNSKKLDARSDIYSLGITLYECLTGKLPFESENTLELLYKVSEESPRPLITHNDKIPETLNNICLKAIAKNPAERYKNCRELAQDLERFLDGLAPYAKAQKIALKQIYLNHKKKIFTIVAIFMLTLGGIGMYMLKNLELGKQNKKLKSNVNKAKKVKRKLKKQQKILAQKNKKVKALLRLTQWSALLNQQILPKQIDSEKKINQSFQDLSKITQSDEIYINWAKAFMLLRNKFITDKKLWAKYLYQARKILNQAILNKNENAIFYGYYLSTLSMSPEINIFKYLPNDNKHKELKTIAELWIKTTKSDNSFQIREKIFTQSEIYIKSNPDNYAAQHIRSYMLFYNAKIYKAIVRLKEVAELNPLSPLVFHCLGESYQNIGTSPTMSTGVEQNIYYLKRANYYFDISLELNPFHELTMLKKANTCLNLEELTKNKKYLKTAETLFAKMQFQNKFAKGILVRGKIFERLKKYEKAIEIYTQLEITNGRYVMETIKIKTSLARLYEKKKDYKSAIVHTQQLIHYLANYAQKKQDKRFSVARNVAVNALRRYKKLMRKNK